MTNYTSKTEYTADELTGELREELGLEQNIPLGLIVIRTVQMPRVVEVISPEQFQDLYAPID